jgi:hypothetical protein
MKTQNDTEYNTKAELHWKEYSVIQNMNLNKTTKLQLLGWARNKPRQQYITYSYTSVQHK